MQDVVAVALIAAGIGLVGNLTTATFVLVNGSRQRVADAIKLRADHREADRRERRTAYANLLNAIAC